MSLFAHLGKLKHTPVISERILFVQIIYQVVGNDVKSVGIAKERTYSSAQYTTFSTNDVVARV